MSPSSPCIMRIHREIHNLVKQPPEDFICRPKFDDLTIEIIMHGANGTCYADGTFILELSVPKKFPFETPKLQFMTPIYHPNVDITGRICLIELSGAWLPTYTLRSLLIALRYLVYHPDVDDPLMPERAIQFKYDHEEFIRKCREWTQIFAPKLDLNVLKPPLDYNRKRQFEQDEVNYVSGSRKRYY